MGSTWPFVGVRFAYGQEQVLAALDSNVEYARHRRQHGEKAARTTAELGQAISYRFKRDEKGWRVFATTSHDGRAGGYGSTARRHRRGSQRRPPGCVPRPTPAATTSTPSVCHW